VARGLNSGGGTFRKKLVVDDELDITPMIDATFLLLIFFMVTSTMQGKTLALPEAKHGLGVSTKDAVVVSVFNDDGEPAVYLADGTRDNGPVELVEVGTYVKESGRKVMIIKADENVPSGFVEDVARVANDEVEDLEFFVGITDKQRR